MLTAKTYILDYIVVGISFEETPNIINLLFFIEDSNNGQKRIRLSSERLVEIDNYNPDSFDWDTAFKEVVSVYKDKEEE